MKKSIIKITAVALSLAILACGCNNNNETSSYTTSEIIGEVASYDEEYYAASVGTEQTDKLSATAGKLSATEETLTETSEQSTEQTSENTTEEQPAQTEENAEPTVPALNTNDEVYSFLYGNVVVQANKALVYDVESGRILYGKNADKMAFPASITKIITIMTALEYISPDTAFTVGTEIHMPEEGSSLAYLAEGQELSMRMLIYALLLPSGNDAAYAVAVNVARIAAEDMSLSDEEAADYFAELMNKFAKKIGAENTHFACCDGFHRDDHYTTAEDLMLFVKKAMEYEVITSVCSQPQVDVRFLSGEIATWYNSNALIYPDSEYYLDYVTGMKTGFTDEAGYCFVGTADKNGRKMIVVALGCESIESRWNDVRALFEAGYEYAE